MKEGFGYSSAAVGTKVVFAPSGVNAVGVFDVATNTFQNFPMTGSPTVTISADNPTWGNFGKYAGAAAVGTRVYFAPCSENTVGSFDTATNQFSIVATSGLAATGTRKYAGALAFGTNKVIFVPSNADNVGIIDTATNTFSTGAPVSTEPLKFYGAADLGTRAIFAPFYQADSVGQFMIICSLACSSKRCMRFSSLEKQLIMT